MAKGKKSKKSKSAKYNYGGYQGYDYLIPIGMYPESTYPPPPPMIGGISMPSDGQDYPTYPYSYGKPKGPKKASPKKALPYPIDEEVLPVYKKKASKRYRRKKAGKYPRASSTPCLETEVAPEPVDPTSTPCSTDTVDIEVAPKPVDPTSTPCSDTVDNEVAPETAEPPSVSDDCLEDESDYGTSMPGAEPTGENEESFPVFDHPTDDSSEDVATLPADEPDTGLDLPENTPDTVISGGFKLTISVLSGFVILVAI
jgi:hypothetical protein